MAESAKLTNQIIAGLIAMLGGFSLGMVIGWSSPIGLIVENEVNKTNSSWSKDDLKKAEMIKEDFFWVASIMPVGAMCVMFPVAFLLDRLGRKWTMLAAAPILAVAFIIVAVFFNFWAWLVGRFIMGFAGAAFCVAAPIYVGEVSDSRVRGALGTCFQLLLVVGIALEYCLGLSNSYQVISYISAAFPVIFAVLFIFMPESPRSLLIKDQPEKANKAMQWFRGKDYDITEELAEMQKGVDEMKGTKVTIKDLFRDKAVIKSMITALILMIAQQVSGINVVMFYATTLFKESGAALSPNISSIILAVVQIIGTLTATFVVDRVGRKILLYVSFGGMGVFLIFLGGWYIYLEHGPKNVNEGLRSLPIIFLCVYLLFFSFGSGPIPWSIIGEIFPKELRGMCGSISAFVNWGFAFIITSTFSKFNDSTPKYVPFFIYAAFCVVTVVFVFFYVIETKGKTLEEIQEELRK